MKTLLELIESWFPCDTYYRYLNNGVLTPQTTVKDILNSKTIYASDKEWFFDCLIHYATRIDHYIDVNMGGDVSVMVGDKSTVYTCEEFLAMIYEMLEHTYEDVAI